MRSIRKHVFVALLASIACLLLLPPMFELVGHRLHWMTTVLWFGTMQWVVVALFLALVAVLGIDAIRWFTECE